VEERHVNDLDASDSLFMTENVNHSLALSFSLAKHEKNSGHYIDRRNERIL
jgi:hypothetical protein